LIIYHSAGDREALALQRSGVEAARKIVENERLIMQNCSSIVVENENSKKYKFNNYDNVYVLSSGVDVDVFDVNKSYDIPQEYDFTKKTILYVGTIEVWVDIDLICNLARQIKNANIYLVGPVRRNVDPKKLKNYDNIIMTGVKPYGLMPSYIKYSDVCIVPFKDTPSLKFSSTLKCLQYLSMGKNVVSTYYEGINSYDDCVHVENTHSKFIDKVKMLLSGRNEDKNIAYDFVKKHSWDAHVADLISKMRIEIK
jgi:glycosyltransferase involved in cell wall biosynthesis